MTDVPGAHFDAMSDEAVMAAYVRGARAEEALTDLFHRYGTCVRSVCVAYFRGGDSVDDAVQEAFLAVARYAHTFRGGQAMPWLYRIAVNSCHLVERGRPARNRARPGSRPLQPHRRAPGGPRVRGRGRRRPAADAWRPRLREPSADDARRG